MQPLLVVGLGLTFNARRCSLCVRRKSSDGNIKHGMAPYDGHEDSFCKGYSSSSWLISI
jgi:hypothetical protein